MVSGQKRYAVGRFYNYVDVKYTTDKLNSAGFLVAQISVVAKYADQEHQIESAGLSDCAGDEAQEDAAGGAIAGGMLGAVIGCLAGLGMLVVPGVGFIVAVGTTGTALATTLAGAGIGAASGGLISAIAGLEMASDQARVDSVHSLRGEFLVMVDGTDEQLRRAESILSRSSSSKVWVC